MPEQNRDKSLKAVRDEIFNCGRCPLRKTRIYPVVGEGSHQAEIMFIGEAPGAQEDKTGHPFCGASGKILDELLASAGIRRSDIYIANLLKCRPPSNRDPEPEEIEACVFYLEKQIDIIKPKVICPLGRYAMRVLMEKFGLKDSIEPISKIHGKIFEVKNLFSSLKIIPLYHPAVAAYNPNMKELLKKDFQILNKFEASFL